MVTALMADAIGSWTDSSCSRSMTTDVSVTPCRARGASGTGAGVLEGGAVEVGAGPRQVDARSAWQHRDGGVGIHEPVAPRGSQFSDGYAMTGDDEGLTPVRSPHGFATADPELTLRDVSSRDLKYWTSCSAVVVRLPAHPSRLTMAERRAGSLGVAWRTLDALPAAASPQSATPRPAA